MNQATTRQYDEFVFRRLTEPFPAVGNHLEPRGNTILWLAVLFTILFVGLIYVGIMYLRDSRGVGIVWAGLLGLLRLGVYAAIAFVFLLPSKQSYEETSASSRVIVLFDVSDSMTTRDDIPRPGQAYEELPTRGKKLQDFLEDSRLDFFGNLIKKNPVVAYRFSAGLDGSPVYFDTDGRTYTKEEYTELEEKRKLPGFQKETEPRPLGHDYLFHFINPITDPNAKPVALPDDLNSNDKDRFEKLIAHNRKLAQNNIFKGTNVGDATLNTLTREVNNMAQGIVIFTDGRSTEGTDAAYEQIAKLAKSANIPIFVVGIGSVRPQVRIDITDFRAPQQVQPEDKFRVVAEIQGEGLADKEFAPELHIVYSRKKEDGKEERFKIYIMEQEDKKNPMKARERIDLGEELVLKPEAPVKFDTSSPPRAEIEFVIDAAALAKANNPPIDLVGDPQYKGKKWEIGETKEGDVSNPSALRFQLTVPKNNLELFADKQHKSDLLDLKVMKRPLRVLLFASAATHDFQFLNNMMLREVEQQRADLAVYVQPPPGKQPEEWFKTVVLGVKPDRLLLHFPTRYDQPSDDPKEQIYDLNEYDVIVAFDPDWSKLNDDQLKLVNTWCSKGGGLVMVGGPINTLQLARPGPNKVKLQPVLDLLPVVLADVRINALDRTTENPWPLTWGDAANNELEFLRLTEEGDQENVSFKEGWNQFFHGNKEGTGPVKRGFFNYYPTELVKSGSLVVARFGDPKAKMKDGSQMPWLVLNAAGSQHRVVWIAWGETRRLRQHSEGFYERFWIKMLRYAGAHNQTDLVRRVRLDMSRTYTAGRYVQIEAKIDDRGGQPLAPKHDRDMPNIQLTLPAGVKEDEIKTKIPLVPKKVRDDSDRGRFSARFQVKSPGDYKLELKVPETGDSIIQKFSVKESNPEMDNTRPDFDQMYRLASDAEQVLARIPVEADRQEVKRNLLPPKLEDKGAKDEVLKEGKPRLYFTLENARLIPSCMVTKTDTKQIRGPYKDVWDFGLRKDDHDPLFFFFNVLALIVGLLSVEWLIRKLLRLA